MKINQTTFFNQLPEFTSVQQIEDAYAKAEMLKPGPIIVLDDDPTGIQTVHGIPVYMSWEKAVMEQIFKNKETAFIHINTRAYSREKVRHLLIELMENAVSVSKASGKDFEIISRSDSTLRGHYPLETEIIRKEYEKGLTKKIDGEIIVPFFKEGGRLTVNDTHYVVDGNDVVPASETEFAKDPDFGYQHADLKWYVEEKTGGKYPHEQVISISLDMLRRNQTNEIRRLLSSVHDFGKIVLNAVEYTDLKAFIPALLQEIAEGKKFVYRAAASFVKTFGYIDDKPLLDRNSLNHLTGKSTQILLIAGSYTGKTTSQLDGLFRNHQVEKVELNVQNLLEGDLEGEISNIAIQIDNLIKNGQNPVLYTSRTLVKTRNHLQTAETISNALVSIVQALTQRPDVIVAKGGITSSVIAVNGLKIKKAKVEGQVLPGVPLIVAGEESKWPGLPYVIFPGNVGHKDSIAELYGMLVGNLK